GHGRLLKPVPGPRGPRIRRSRPGHLSMILMLSFNAVLQLVAFKNSAASVWFQNVGPHAAARKACGAAPCAPLRHGWLCRIVGIEHLVAAIRTMGRADRIEQREQQEACDEAADVSLPRDRGRLRAD